MTEKYQKQLELEKLNKEIFDRITTEVPADEFIEFYINHNKKETLEYYNIRTEKLLKKILIFFNYDFSKPKPSKFKGKSACRSHESYVEAGKKSSETQKQHWAEKSDEEKQAWSEKQSLAHLNSPTFKDKITKINRDYRASLTNDQKQIMDLQRSQALKAWWATLTPEEQSEVQANRFKNGQVYSIKDSRPNKAFAQALQQTGITFEREYCLDQKFFDFKVNNTLIEVDPTFTHNSTFNPFSRAPLDKNYHKEKTNTAIKYNFRCIHIFDWDDKEKLIKMLLPCKTIFARKCAIKEVCKEDALNFINKYHLQGYARDKIRIGLFDANTQELLSIMTFGKPRYNKKYEYELIRYCTKAGLSIIGGANKLFKFFIKNYQPQSIISYCDLSKFTGSTYTSLGFDLLRISTPSKHWYNSQTKEHILDSLLRQQGFDRLFKANYGVGSSNNELMRAHGFVEVYDCGQATYIWNAKN